MGEPARLSYTIMLVACVLLYKATLKTRVRLQQENLRCATHLNAVSMALMTVISIARAEAGGKRATFKRRLDEAETEIRQAFKDDAALLAKFNAMEQP